MIVSTVKNIKQIDWFVFKTCTENVFRQLCEVFFTMRSPLKWNVRVNAENINDNNPSRIIQGYIKI